MNRFKFLACATLSIVTFAAGCTGGAGRAMPPSAPGYRAVVAAGGNSSRTVFLVPVGSGGTSEATAVAPAGTTVCPGCRAEAERYFRTGRMATNCALCNAALSPARQ